MDDSYLCENWFSFTVIANVAITGVIMLLTKALELYLSRPNLAENTRKSYRRLLGGLIGMLGNKPIHEISQADLMRHIANEQSRGAAARSLNLATNFFKSFFGWLWHNEYLKKNPAMRLETVHIEPIPDEVRAIATDDWRKLSAYVRERSVRDYALLSFILDTACRVSAAAVQTVRGLDIPNLKAYGYEAKIRRRVEFSFGEECAIALENWLELRPKVEHDLLFTSAYKPYGGLANHSIREMMKRACVGAGIANWTPHSLRHAELQNLANQPDVTLVDVQKKANHMSAKTTIDSYYVQKSKRVAELTRRYSLVGEPKESEKVYPEVRILPKLKSS
jgi:site-specific recombinase XerD